MYNYAETEEFTELAVLIPGWQARALEEAAHREGVTGGQLIRQVLNACFSREGGWRGNWDSGRGMGHFAES